MNLVLAGITLLMATMPGIGFAAEMLDGVAAIVNDRVITYSEVRNYIEPVVRQMSRNYRGQELIDKIKAAQLDALNSLIDRTLIVQEFNEKGFLIPGNIVEEQLNDIIENDFDGDRATFAKTLAAENMTLSAYRQQMRDRIIVQLMRNQKVQREVVVSPFQIEKYYQENIDQFKVDDQVKLRMIFIKKAPPRAGRAQPASSVTTNPGQGGMAEASETNSGPSEPAEKVADDIQYRLGMEILSKLDAGESFSSMAKVYSEGEEAHEGGDWGWVRRNVLREELDEVAFALEPDRHSRLIETTEGYYILRVDDVKESYTMPLSEVRDQIEKTLLRRRREKMQKNWIQKLRDKAYIRFF